MTGKDGRKIPQDILRKLLEKAMPEKPICDETYADLDEFVAAMIEQIKDEIREDCKGEI